MTLNLAETSRVRLRLDQDQTPFLDSLLVEKERWQTSFHMPGHKGTLPPAPKLVEYWGGDIHAADLVEINGIIDYLHSPKGALLEAQKLAADAHGADHTFFLINGSTVGNIASIMATCFDGDRVIMPRASHRSVYGGVVLSGAIPLYVERTTSPRSASHWPPAPRPSHGCWPSTAASKRFTSRRPTTTATCQTLRRLPTWRTPPGRPSASMRPTAHI